VAQAYIDVGLRAVIAPMVADISIFHALPGLIDVLPAALRRDLEARSTSPADIIIAQNETLFRDWRSENDLIRLAVSPAIAHHCSDALFQGLAALAREHGAGLHTHLAESKAQAVAGVKRFGKTLTAYLDDLGVLGPNVTVAHGVWLDREDVRRLADHGVSLAHNPGSNMRLGNGVADVRTMLDSGLNVGIGTDGARASDHQNMYEAAHLADLISKSRGPDGQGGLTAAETFDAATRGSARALGLDDIGLLEAGYKADIVFLDLKSLNWIPLNDPLLQVIHVEDGTGVDSVMIGGRMVVERGRPTSVDLNAMAAEAACLQPRFANLLTQNQEILAQVEKVAGQFCGALAAEPYHVDRHGMRSA
jgi:guanine deaminase